MFTHRGNESVCAIALLYQTEAGTVGDTDPEIGVDAMSHDNERVLAGYQSYFDLDGVVEELILENTTCSPAVW